ncbi:hypothetical protein OG211_12220 [Streptomyces niveus]|uniref:hypothetical protein n=1 Tax=Streptomyces niveus TaxID=193462 RepID=UPI00386D51D5|nr:hypothetical protein OG211_12220 [Streptomyces niveus]
MPDQPEPTIRPDAELYVLLRKAGVDRHDAQALIDAHAAHARTMPAASGVQPDTRPAMCACDGQTLLEVHTPTGCRDVAPAHEIPLGHSTPSHRVLGWCSHCPGRSLAEEVGAWQVDALDRTTTTGPTGDGRDVENERLRTENERMRHELEVMYGGAFDSPPGGQAEDGAQQPEPVVECKGFRGNTVAQDLCAGCGNARRWHQKPTA